jgi:2,3-bisphosphoglycerate-dependent phosphoglycerate mutase
MGWVQGQVDGARLTRRGRWQARTVADQLAGETIGTLYASDLYRARRTAAAIAKRCGLEPKTDRRLRERCFGLAEGVPTKMVPSALTGIADGVVVDPAARPPGGESLDDVYWRCASFLLELEASPAEGDAVVVAHGGSIRMLRAVAAHEQLRGLAWKVVPNASVSRFTVPALAPADG